MNLLPPGKGVRWLGSDINSLLPSGDAPLGTGSGDLTRLGVETGEEEGEESWEYMFGRVGCGEGSLS